MASARVKSTILTPKQNIVGTIYQTLDTFNTLTLSLPSFTTAEIHYHLRASLYLLAAVEVDINTAIPKEDIERPKVHQMINLLRIITLKITILADNTKDTRPHDITHRLTEIVNLLTDALNFWTRPCSESQSETQK